MTTIISGDSDATVGAVQQIGLISSAAKVIKPYGSTSLTMVGIQSCNWTCISHRFKGLTVQCDHTNLCHSITFYYVYVTVTSQK